MKVSKHLNLLNTNKNLLIVLWVFIALVVCGVDNMGYAADEGEGVDSKYIKNILFVDSAHMRDSLDDDDVDLFVSKIENCNKSTEINVIRLDSKRIYNKQYREKRLEILLAQFPKGYYDLIIAKGDSALKTIYDTGQEKFGNTPLVFYNVSGYDKSKYPNSTGIISNCLIQENTDFIYDIFPETKYLAVITDNSIHGKVTRKKIKERLNKDNRLSAIYLNGDVLTDSQLIDRIQNLPPHTCVFFDSWDVGMFGKYNREDVLENIFIGSAIPIFTNKYSFVKLGALGGIVRDFASVYDVISCSIIPDILSEKRTAPNIRIELASKGNAVLNWQIMEKYKEEANEHGYDVDYYNQPESIKAPIVNKAKSVNILYQNSPPWISKNRHGELEGALVDVWRLWAKKTKRDIRFVDNNTIDKNSIDGVCCFQAGVSDVVIDDSKMSVSHNMNTLLITTASLYHSRDKPIEYEWNAYRNKRIAIVRNDSFKDFLVDKIPNVTVVVYNSRDDLIDSVGAGTFDAFFMEDMVAKVMLNNAGVGHHNIGNKYCSVKIKVAPHQITPNHSNSELVDELTMISRGFGQISFEMLHSIFSLHNNKLAKIYPIFTPEELFWKENINAIRISCSNDLGGIQSWDKGVPVGVIPDLLRYYMNSIDIKFEFARKSDYLDDAESLKEGVVDLASFASQKHNNSLINSIPYFKQPIVAMSSDRSVFIGDAKSIIAVPNSYIGYYYHLKRQFPDNVIVLAESPKDSVAMVKDGVADIAVVSKLNADLFKESPEYKSLHSHTQYNMVFNYCIGLFDNYKNSVFLSIINKVIITTPKEIVNVFVNKYAVKKKREVSLMEILIYVAPWVIGSVIVILVLWVYTSKRALNRLNDSEANLQKEKAWLSATMRSIGEGVIATDVHGRVVQMNTVAEQLTKCKERQAVGRPTNEIYKIHNIVSSLEEKDPIEIVLQEMNVVDLQHNIVLVNSAKVEIPITATAAPIIDEFTKELLGGVLVFKDIRAESVYRKQLNQAKVILSNAIELAGVSYFTYDISKNKIIVSSGKKESHLYVDQNSLRLNDILPGIISDDLICVQKTWEKLLASKISKFRANYRSKGVDGVRYNRVDIRSEVGDFNRLERVFGVRLDVTDTVEAENISRERLEQAYDLAKLLYFEYSPIKDEMSVNPQLKELLMIDSEKHNLSLKEVIVNVVPEDKNNLMNILGHVRNDHMGIYEKEIRVCKRGQQKIVKVFANNKYSEDGTWIASMGCVLDITELNYVQKELEVSEEQKRLILGSIKESVVYINRDLELVWANKATYKVFECDDLIPLSSEWNTIVYGGPSPDMSCNTASVIRGTSETLVESMNYEGKEFLVSLNPIRDKKGNVTHLVKTFSDVSEFKEIQNNLKKAYNKAETANKAKSTFLSTMTHEIRTPLNAIIGFSGLLQYEKLDSKSTSYANSINTAATGLLGLINNVLDLSRLEADKMTLSLGAVCLNELLQEMEILFGVKAKAKGINLAINIDDNMPAFLLDSHRLRQVLINIIGNAIKFTNYGSVSVNTKYNSFKDTSKGMLQIIIADTGIGIPIVDQKRMFESFEQHENSSKRRYEGTGLGLSISKRLVELMNGAIVLNSEINEGSEFTIVFKDVQQVDKAKKSSVMLKHTFGEFEKEKVLLVTRNQNDLTIITSMFGKMGLDSETTSSVEDAVELMKEEHFKLVITTLLEKECAPESLCAQFFECIKQCGSAVVALTGHVDPQEHFDTSKFSDIIIKPITIEQFSEVVGKYFVQIGELKVEGTHDDDLAGELSVDDLDIAVIKDVLDTFGDKFEAMMHGIVMDDAKIISTDFIAFAAEYKDPVLISIANKLDQYIATFKLPDMMYIIKLFLKHKDEK